MHDFHTHFIPEDVLTWIKDHKQTVNASWIKNSQEKEEFLSINNKWAFELKKEFVDANLYLDQKKQVGVTHAIVSPIPQLFLYDFPSEITSNLASVYNHALAKWSKSNSEDLSALATVSLNNPELAARDLRDAMALGLKGAIIGPGLNGTLLSDTSFTPFWEEANKQKAIIFIHPLLCEDPRLKQRMMPNLIGVPWETTISATDLLLSGMLDTYPEVKILLAHGGGFLPYQIGRMNKGYEMWPLVSNALQKEPTEYLKDFWYDTVLWNENTLEYLVKSVGEERIVPGSDFPFDLCAWPPATNFANGSNSLLKD
ncbi:2-amino-3-carboxymuconate-6-semialdehyde decarboxylase [Halalkalibacter wakoensis JCM 9140]|uniref:2-amino-3-carboxymuconate-6-semialdehyde decarboxylase n=1 Tax=Halalkalibacter wakoensis JCM 9140 TaxID=1236970 RepID=W4Q3C7_9BACI|nr:amidohydrolase family protein [Halalkalibacter wakoensis]GAE26586.1 2-amino-3-carboxymuconate-6-semialdehyde decarboxylase [Halalkalibacter wakoensis JCM 9140]